MKKMMITALAVTLAVGLIGCSSQDAAQIQPEGNAMVERSEEVDKSSNEDVNERGGSLNVDKVNEVLTQLVEDGEITEEQKAQLLIDFENGDMSELQELMGGRRN